MKSQSPQHLISHEKKKEKVGVRYVTLELIRKRSEHNGNMVSNLEEISLHQEELEQIGAVLGRTCGKTLKILLLQNNVISHLQSSEMRPFKSLEYLNLALNNLDRVSNSIDHLEFLNKLDLTLNFIDVDTLEETIDSLSRLRSLKELYMLGNPCVYVNPDSANIQSDSSKELQCGKFSLKNDNNNVSSSSPMSEEYKSSSLPSNNVKSIGWRNFRSYVIARLKKLKYLDGKEVLRSERIKATQCLSQLEAELTHLSDMRRKQKKELVDIYEADEDDKVDEDELLGHTPEVRVRLSKEMAKQKEEKEENERSNQPRRRGEKEFDEEQQAIINRERSRDDGGEFRQCNEGKYKFRFDEETIPGYLLLDISTPKFLSSSLIDIDIHPKQITVIIKSKVLRLTLPAEVKVNESTAQRSSTIGNLLIKMPKYDPNENMMSIRMQQQCRSKKVIPCRKKSSKLVYDMLHQGEQSWKKKFSHLDEIVTTKEVNKEIESSNIGLHESQTKLKVLALKPIPQDLMDPDSSNLSSDNYEDDPPPLY